MNFQKEIEKEIKKRQKKSKKSEIKIKGVIINVDGNDEILTLSACPPNGCPKCPPIC